jgi:hypothetical protein
MTIIVVIIGWSAICAAAVLNGKDIVVLGIITDGGER